ncbi:MAG: Cell division protein ZapA [bacterium]|nr:Cell division protein ZapA [bacterium]
MPEQQHVTVTIMGRNYTLRAEEDPQYVRMIAAYVDDKLQEIAKVSPRMSTTRLAILAAINIADELHKLERGLQAGGNREAESTVDRILNKVEAAKG